MKNTLTVKIWISQYYKHLKLLNLFCFNYPISSNYVAHGSTTIFTSPFGSKRLSNDCWMLLSGTKLVSESRGSIRTLPVLINSRAHAQSSGVLLAEAFISTSRPSHSTGNTEVGFQAMATKTTCPKRLAIVKP